MAFAGCGATQAESAIDCIQQLQEGHGFDLTSCSRIVFLPETGCAGCISSGLKYLLEHKQELFEMNYIFVFVDVLDQKKLRNKIGSDIFNSERIYFVEGCWRGQALTRPLEVAIINGKPSEIDVWSPERSPD